MVVGAAIPGVSIEYPRERRNKGKRRRTGIDAVSL
jgi:hypothetical protein